MKERLTIKTLGALSLERHESQVAGLVSRKAEALLLYLAVNPGLHARETLATLLWDDRPQQRALGNLSVLLSSLRKELEPFILTTWREIGINPDSDVWLDAAVLEARLKAVARQQKQHAHLTRNAAALLEQAVTLYQGDFLEGFYVRDAGGFEEWLLLERERLHRLVVEALDLLVDFYLQRGKFKAGIEVATWLLRLDGLREEAHRQLMRLLAQSGQRSAALAQYDSCCRLLREELDVTPAAETIALYEEIRSEASGAAPAGRGGTSHNLPAETTPFIGREALLQQIERQLDVPDCRLLTLVGPGGAGKTRLALQAARHKIGEFLHGIWFVPLADVTSADFLLPALVSSLNLPTSGQTDLAAFLLEHLQAREMLLVLDNFEHLLGGADFLVKLLQRAPEVKLLLTSQERLNLAAEWLIEVNGLAYAADTGDSEAVQLFVQRASRITPQFSPTPPAMAAAGRICRLVAGLPLGIEPAATWVRYLPVMQISDAIEASLDFLTVSMPDLPARHRSLRLVFAYTWERLTAAEQKLFGRLAVFRGGFDLAAAAAVAGELPAGDILPLLASLTDKSLLQTESESGERIRFAMLETVRAYALEQLEQRGEEASTQRRHAEYYLSLAEEAAPYIKKGQEAEWFSRLEGEHSNLRAALTWLGRQKEYETAAQLCSHLWFFWYVRGYYTEGRQHIEALLAQALPALLRANLLHAAGTLAIVQADNRAAQHYLEESVALKEALGDLSGMARTLNNLGIVFYNQNDYERAMALYEESLALKRQFGRKLDIAFALNNLSSLAYNRGDLARAEPYFEESLTFFRQAGGSQGEALALINLGIIALAHAQLERARRLSEAGIALRRQLGDVRGLAQALYNLAAVVRRQGMLDRARAYCLETLALFEQAQDSFGMMMALCGLAFVAGDGGEMAQAAHLLGAVEAIGRAIEVEPPASELEKLRRLREEGLRQLGEAPFQAAWVDGSRLSLEAAVAYVRESRPASAGRHQAG